ncbi:uncharacterized protein [Erythrolamprus reginae]|uniref:uncharacterized protein isoform X2 n=1 Tax=Erythrolamprus reginae TaxID=121349 RepID=UPI00396C96F4
MQKELGERGYNIDHIQMTTAILTSLNEDWKEAITKCLSIPLPQRTTSRVCQILTEEEIIMERMLKSRSTTTRAPASRGYQQRSNQSRRSDFQRSQSADPQRSQYPAQPRGRGSRGGRRRSSRNYRSAQRGSGSKSHSKINTLIVKNVPDLNCEYSTRHLWTLDSRAAFHITHQRELFTELHETDIKEVYAVSNHVCQVEGEGTIYIDELDQMIPRIIYIPDAGSNILSLHRLNKDLVYKAMLLNYDIHIIRNGTVVAYAIPIGGVFYLKPNFRSLVDVHSPLASSFGPCFI